MIRIQTKLPRSFYLAVSGGVDSIAALHFLHKNHDIGVLYFDHCTKTSEEAYHVVERTCNTLKLPMFIGSIQKSMETGQSLEEYWRTERYNFFSKFQDGAVVTCHHLDDCVETWVWSSLHGNPNIIPLRNKNVLRPFRLTPKSEFIDYATRNNLEWHEDYSNNDMRHIRNYIRKELLPKAYHVNPGLRKVIMKKVEEDCDE